MTKLQKYISLVDKIAKNICHCDTEDDEFGNSVTSEHPVNYYGEHVWRDVCDFCQVNIMSDELR